MTTDFEYRVEYQRQDGSWEKVGYDAVWSELEMARCFMKQRLIQDAKYGDKVLYRIVRREVTDWEVVE